MDEVLFCDRGEGEVYVELDMSVNPLNFGVSFIADATESSMYEGRQVKHQSL